MRPALVGLLLICLVGGAFARGGWFYGPIRHDSTTQPPKDPCNSRALFRSWYTKKRGGSRENPSAASKPRTGEKQAMTGGIRSADGNGFERQDVLEPVPGLQIEHVSEAEGYGRPSDDPLCPESNELTKSHEDSAMISASGSATDESSPTVPSTRKPTVAATDPPTEIIPTSAPTIAPTGTPTLAPMTNPVTDVPTTLATKTLTAGPTFDPSVTANVPASTGNEKFASRSSEYVLPSDADRDPPTAAVSEEIPQSDPHTAAGSTEPASEGPAIGGPEENVTVGPTSITPGNDQPALRSSEHHILPSNGHTAATASPEHLVLPSDETTSGRTGPSTVPVSEEVPLLDPPTAASEGLPIDGHTEDAIAPNVLSSIAPEKEESDSRSSEHILPSDVTTAGTGPLTVAFSEEVSLSDPPTAVGSTVPTSKSRLVPTTGQLEDATVNPAPISLGNEQSASQYTEHHALPSDVTTVGSMGTPTVAVLEELPLSNPPVAAGSTVVASEGLPIVGTTENATAENASTPIPPGNEQSTLRSSDDNVLPSNVTTSGTMVLFDATAAGSTVPASAGPPINVKKETTTALNVLSSIAPDNEHSELRSSEHVLPSNTTTTAKTVPPAEHVTAVNVTGSVAPGNEQFMSGSSEHVLQFDATTGTGPPTVALSEKVSSLDTPTAGSPTDAWSTVPASEGLPTDGAAENVTAANVSASITPASEQPGLRSSGHHLLPSDSTATGVSEVPEGLPTGGPFANDTNTDPTVPNHNGEASGYSIKAILNDPEQTTAAFGARQDNQGNGSTSGMFFVFFLAGAGSCAIVASALACRRRRQKSSAYDLSDEEGSFVEKSPREYPSEDEDDVEEQSCKRVSSGPRKRGGAKPGQSLQTTGCHPFQEEEDGISNNVNSSVEQTETGGGKHDPYATSLQVATDGETSTQPVTASASPSLRFSEKDTGERSIGTEASVIIQNRSPQTFGAAFPATTVTGLEPPAASIGRVSGGGCTEMVPAPSIL